MKGNKSILLGCAGLCLAMATLGSAFAADPVIANSSFEDGPGGTYAYIPYGDTSLTDWATRLNGVEWFNPDLLGYGWGSAHDGNYIIDLAPTTNTGGGVAIANGITTTPGSDYKLTFYASTLKDVGRDGTGQVDVYINGVLNTSFTLNNSTATIVWEKETVNFTATNQYGTTTYIKFQNEQDANLHFAFIDDVSIAYVPPDADGDGVPDDGTDQCLGTPPNTPVAANGCTDADEDGIADIGPAPTDNCPDSPSGTVVDTTPGLNYGCDALPLADLKVSDVSFGLRSVTLNAGTGIMVEDTVKNLGGDTRRFSVGYYLHGNTDVASTSTRNISSLTAGASNSWPGTNVVIPSDTPSGGYRLCATADSANVVDESDETNNGKCTGTWITVPKPDLKMNQASIFVDTVTAGTSMVILDSHANNGGSQALDYDVGYVLSHNVSFGDGDDILLPTTRHVDVLNVGAYSTDSTSVTIPLDVSPGSYYVFAVADVGHVVAEKYENNNVKRASSTVTVTAPPAP